MSADYEAAFLADVAAAPDDDAPRLIYADWLEEHGRADEAELIRLMLRFDPDRDRFDDPAINALREQINQRLRPFEDAEQRWRKALFEPMTWDVEVEWRRGLVDSLALPVQWFLAHADEFRARYPTLRRLVLFRLNGWGARLAACERLRGLRELELACWYSDDDARAVAASPHLAELRRLVLYSGGGIDQARIFVRAVWPDLRELHLVSGGEDVAKWKKAVNRAAKRQIATAYDFENEPFPFAADFGGSTGFFVGRRPDGTQLFAACDERGAAIDGWLFGSNGRRREPFHHEFPPALALPQPAEARDWREQHQREREIFEGRWAQLGERLGFVPAFIRVASFDLPACGLAGPSRYRRAVEDAWGRADDPDVAPEEDRHQGPWGNGGKVCKAVRTGEFTFDYGNEWWCDRSGHVTST